MEPKPYIIVVGSLEEVENEVATSIREGYRPIGGVCQDSSSGCRFCQAMIYVGNQFEKKELLNG